MSNVLRVYAMLNLLGSDLSLCAPQYHAVSVIFLLRSPDVEEIDGGQKNFMLEEMKKLKEKVRGYGHQARKKY